MNLKTPCLHSISEILPEHCYQTQGSRPVKVFCNDMNDYVCKYSSGFGFQAILFNEFIASYFLKIWNLPVPDFAIVDVKKEHKQQTGYPDHYFSIHCYGSKYNGDFKEVDNIFIANNILRKIDYYEIKNLIKISLFDIWLCNEDRHQGNYNLLFDIHSKCFIPIDHACCFNTCSIDKEPYLISENENILSSHLFNQIFSRTLQQNKKQIRLEIIEDFKIYTKKCYEELDNILNNTPLAWNPDKKFLRQRLLFFFSEQWISDCLNHFNYLFEYFTKKTI